LSWQLLHQHNHWRFHIGLVPIEEVYQVRFCVPTQPRRELQEVTSGQSIRKGLRRQAQRNVFLFSAREFAAVPDIFEPGKEMKTKKPCLGKQKTGAIFSPEIFSAGFYVLPWISRRTRPLIMLRPNLLAQTGALKPAEIQDRW